MGRADGLGPRIGVSGERIDSRHPGTNGSQGTSPPLESHKTVTCPSPPRRNSVNCVSDTRTMAMDPIPTTDPSEEVPRVGGGLPTALDTHTRANGVLQEGDGPDARKIWVLQYGPCWCRGSPSADSIAFDFMRSRTLERDFGTLSHNLLIVTDRAPEGSRGVYVRTYERVPDPKLVIAVATCPAAGGFWDDLPGGWIATSEVIPVDLHVAECISGHPEVLLGAVLGHLLAVDRASDSWEAVVR